MSTCSGATPPLPSVPAVLVLVLLDVLVDVLLLVLVEVEVLVLVLVEVLVLVLVDAMPLVEVLIILHVFSQNVPSNLPQSLL